jgi:hypothetical protein
VSSAHHDLVGTEAHPTFEKQSKYPKKNLEDWMSRRINWRMDFLNLWRVMNGSVIEETGLTIWWLGKVMHYKEIAGPILQHSSTPTIQYPFDMNR